MLKRFNDWYDNLKEPSRFFMAMFICHPAVVVGVFPIYGIVGLLIISPFMIYRLVNH
jgi:hypothetical protein